jgi:hypothetical protein
MISCEIVGRYAQCGVQALACWHTICHISLRCRALGHLARLGGVGKKADAALAAFVSRSLRRRTSKKIGACDQGVAYPSGRACNYMAASLGTQGRRVARTGEGKKRCWSYSEP